jgi:endonuclease-3
LGKGTKRRKDWSKEDITAALRALDAMYPDAKPGLHYGNPFQLLIATILSAQCTDTRVNMVTKELFKKYNTPEAFASLAPAQLKPLIQSCGLSDTKSGYIIESCRRIIHEYGGRVPDSLEALQTLPGVGRKTANVVASNAFGVDAIAVDTHVFRVANRLGIARGKTPLHVERGLMAALPQDRWSRAHHQLIAHGRRVCHARVPQCHTCGLREWCLWEGKEETIRRQGERDV